MPTALKKLFRSEISILLIYIRTLKLIYFVILSLFQQSQVFNNLSADDYKRTLKLIEKAIIQTDLLSYIENEKELNGIFMKEGFHLTNKSHRFLSFFLCFSTSLFHWNLIETLV